MNSMWFVIFPIVSTETYIVGFNEELYIMFCEFKLYHSGTIYGCTSGTWLKAIVLPWLEKDRELP